MQKLCQKLLKLNQEKLEKYFLNQNVSSLQELKLYCDDNYYNDDGEHTLQDHQYDLLKEIIIKKEDTNYVVPVGVKIRENDNKVNLKYYLGSMNKYKTDDEIIRWMTKFPSKKYFIQEKLDGVSCLLTYEHGKITLNTRGDGYIGSNISYYAPYFVNSLPSSIKENISIRGELIMSKEIFAEKYQKLFANPRNMVAGLLNSKTVKHGLEDIEFIPYEIITDKKNQMKTEDQMKKLHSLGFPKIVKYFTFDEEIEERKLSVEVLSEKLLEMKQITEFEMDGIIIIGNESYVRNVANNPDYSFAFKMRLDDNLIQTEIEEIEWNITKWSVLKPRIKVKTVSLGGVKINYCSGFNAKYIVSNQLGKGAIVDITRSNDVIPYIVNVIKPASSPDLPTNIQYKWNETNVDIICEEIDDTMSSIKIITSFFTDMKIKFVSEATIKKLFEAGFNTIPKILQASVEDFLTIKSFKEKSAERIWVNIREALLDVTIPTVLGASNIFGQGIGRRKVNALFKDYPTILEDYEIMSSEEIINKILAIEGFQRLTAEKIVYNLSNAKTFLEEVSPFITFKKKVDETEIVKDETIFYDKKIVLSGFRDKELEKKITELGGNVTSSVSKNTHYLVVLDKTSTSSKITKATELNVPIYEKDEFIELFDL